MRAALETPFKSRVRTGTSTGLMPLAIMVFGTPWAIWCAYSLLGLSNSQALRFQIAAGWFTILAIVYLSLHGIREMQWTSIPVLITFQALLSFLFVPVFGFAMGYETLDTSYTDAMFLVLIAFAAFWFGSIALTSENGISYSPTTNLTSNRVAFMSVALLALGSIGNLVLWKSGLFAYAADEGASASASGILQWLEALANLLAYSLIVSAIEVLGKRSSSKLIRIVFWMSLSTSIGFGILSGMKSGPIRPLVILALVYAITKRRFPRTALLIPIVLVLIVYPFVTAFRSNLNSGYRAQFDTIDGLEQTVSLSFDDAFLSFGASSSSARQQDISETTRRLSYLTYVRDVITLPAPSMLRGDEKLWMAPFYPLIPRFLWKDKPVLDKGHRLSVLLGRGSITSSALTPIGDLYAMFGTYGLVLGMLAWGGGLQLYMNWIGNHNATEKGLCIYLLLMPSLMNLESDYFYLIAGAVQQIVIVSVLAFVVYGRSRPHLLRKARGRLRPTEA